MMRALAVVLPLAAALQGCAFRHVDREILDREIGELRVRTDLGLLWYLGSADGFHYVTYVYGMLQGNRYRIPETELRIESPFPYTDDDKKWRILKDHHDPWPLPEPLRFRPRD